jgi:hypothetical protein
MTVMSLPASPALLVLQKRALSSQDAFRQPK